MRERNNEQSSGQQESDIIIVGGGLAGMCAAYEAVKKGWRPLVVETRSRVGGLIASAKLEGIQFDIGAEAWATRSQPVNQLIKELNLPISYPSGRSWIWNQNTGRSYPIPEGILGLPSDIHAPEVKIAIGEKGINRACEDYQMGTETGLSNTSFANMVRVRLGEAVLEHLVRPVVGGIHTADPEILPVDRISPSLLPEAKRQGSLLRAVATLTAANPGAKVAQTQGGMFRLIEALQEKIIAGGGKILTQCAVTNLSSGWLVSINPTIRGTSPAADPIPTGKAQIWKTKRLILATPAAVTLNLLKDFPAIPKWQLPVGSPIAHQVLMLDAPELNHGPREAGVLISDPRSTSNPKTTIEAKAISHLSYKWSWMKDVLPPSYHLLRVSYGRPGLPSPTPSVTAALQDVNQVFATNIAETQIKASMQIRWDGQLPPGTLEHRQNVEKMQKVLKQYSGLGITGAWVSGSGFAAVVPHAQKTIGELV